jgi:hypothetical protein
MRMTSGWQVDDVSSCDIFFVPSDATLARVAPQTCPEVMTRNGIVLTVRLLVAMAAAERLHGKEDAS